jgi:hypothetical protein
MVKALVKASELLQRWTGGNLFGNPGADTGHYGTASDEMGPFLSSQDRSERVWLEG